jgi:hypothetical protein
MLESGRENILYCAGCGFFILDIGLRENWIQAENPGHPFGTPSVVLLVAFLVILWAEGIFDRR